MAGIPAPAAISACHGRGIVARLAVPAVHRSVKRPVAIGGAGCWPLSTSTGAPCCDEQRAPSRALPWKRGPVQRGRRLRAGYVRPATRPRSIRPHSGRLVLLRGRRQPATIAVGPASPPGRGSRGSSWSTQRLVTQRRTRSPAAVSSGVRSISSWKTSSWPNSRATSCARLVARRASRCRSCRRRADPSSGRTPPTRRCGSRAGSRVEEPARALESPSAAAIRMSVRAPRSTRKRATSCRSRTIHCAARRLVVDVARVDVGAAVQKELRHLDGLREVQRQLPVAAARVNRADPRRASGGRRRTSRAAPRDGSRARRRARSGTTRATASCHVVEHVEAAGPPVALLVDVGAGAQQHVDDVAVRRSHRRQQRRLPERRRRRADRRAAPSAPAAPRGCAPLQPRRPRRCAGAARRHRRSSSPHPGMRKAPIFVE